MSFGRRVGVAGHIPGFAGANAFACCSSRGPSVRYHGAMSNEIRIRTFRPEDAGEVVALWEQTGLDRPWLDLHAEIVEKRKRDRSLFLVAEEGATVVGAVMGAYDGRRGAIYHLAVAPDRQMTGLGKRLMHAAEDRMRRLGVVKVLLQVRNDNRGVAGFYTGLGYEDQDVTTFGKWL